jgi:hypothetical protein
MVQTIKSPDAGTLDTSVMVRALKLLLPVVGCELFDAVLAGALLSLIWPQLR